MKRHKAESTVVSECVHPPYDNGLFYTFPTSAVLNTIQLAEWGVELE